ncbi:hypothetical protein DMENIID0001_121670 [Sergentomyia squamirostris]
MERLYSDKSRRQFMELNSAIRRPSPANPRISKLTGIAKLIRIAVRITQRLDRTGLKPDGAAFIKMRCTSEHDNFTWEEEHKETRGEFSVVV